jgi:hypothetical protein
LGLSGVPMIIRKEYNFRFFRLKGWPAIFMGLMLAIIFFGIALLPYIPKITP